MEVLTQDTQGNLYVTGTFTAYCDLLPGQDELFIPEAGSYSNFLLKLTPSGEIDWIKPIDFEIEKLLFRNSSMLFVGSFNRQANIDLRDTATYMVTPQVTGERDLLVAEWDSSGALLWAETCVSPEEVWGVDLIIDKLGNIIVVGNAIEEPVNVDPGVTDTTLPVSGTFPDLFVVKYNPGGEFVWARHWGESYSILLNSILSQNGGELLFVMETHGVGMDMDPTADTDWFAPTDPVKYSMMVKLSADGDYLWGRGLDMPKCTASINQSGMITLIGTEARPGFDLDFMSSNVTELSESADQFICRYNSDFEVLDLQELSLPVVTAVNANEEASHLSYERPDAIGVWSVDHTLTNEGQEAWLDVGNRARPQWVQTDSESVYLNVDQFSNLNIDLNNENTFVPWSGPGPNIDITYHYPLLIRLSRSHFDSLLPINPPLPSDDLRVYPNPATVSARIHFPVDSRAHSISVINSEGIVVRTISDLRGAMEFELNVESLTSGQYFLKAEFEHQKVMVRKFVVLK